MVRTDAAKNADQKYKASKTKQVVIRFYPGDIDLHEHLQAQGNKMGYIKRLIQEDIERLHPVNARFAAWKYSGGTYCGNGDFETLDQALAFADDGFCDYVRVQNYETGQVIKMHFTPTEDD